MNTNTTNELSNQAPGNPFAVQASAGSGALAAMTSNAAVTSVLASIWIAKQFPRNLAEVTLRMKQACDQPKLAQSATYSYPRGNTTVTGPSIRLAEALIGAWGNAEAGWKEVARHWDPKGADGSGCNVSECLAYCFDKETNVRREIAFSVPHTRDKNEYEGGRKVMKRVALDSERDIYELCANMASRRIRACILQVLPGWLTDEAMEAVKITQENGFKRSKDDILRSLEANFLVYGVTRARLEARLGHKLEEMSVNELRDLSNVYNGIVEGVRKVRDEFPADDQPARDPSLPETPASAHAPKAAPRTTQAPPPVTAPMPEDGIPGLDVTEDVPSFGSFEH